MFCCQLNEACWNCVVKYDESVAERQSTLRSSR
jgi:hypothetical protein